MRTKSPTSKAPAERVLKDIRRATRRHFSADDKIRIVLEGLRGVDSIAEPCRLIELGYAPFNRGQLICKISLSAKCLRITTQAFGLRRATDLSVSMRPSVSVPNQ